MSGSKEPSANADNTFTQADLDRARAEGRADGVKEGVKAERTRIQSIVSSDEAKGREASARHIAFNTDMSVDDAKGVLAGLAAAPVAAAPPPAPAARGPLGISTVEQPGAKAPAANINTSDIYASRRKSAGA